LASPVIVVSFTYGLFVATRSFGGVRSMFFFSGPFGSDAVIVVVVVVGVVVVVVVVVAAVRAESGRRQGRPFRLVLRLPLDDRAHHVHHHALLLVLLVEVGEL
ncbi:unnamed protein product, partial [Ectocarpus sp. 8 AP-2014]